MKNNLIILFDLENTVIKHWTDRSLINISDITNLIRIVENKNVIYGVYSYALWCDNNINDFNENIRPEVETLYGIKFTDDYIFHVKDLMVDYERKNGKLDYSTYTTLVNKEKSLLDFHFNNPKFHERDIVLIDDTVYHELLITYLDTDKMVLFLKPDKLNNLLIKI